MRSRSLTLPFVAGGSEEIIRRYASAAGIEINGRGRADLRVLDSRFYDRLLRQGALGMGESYMDEWWECDHIDEMICRFIESGIINNATFDWRAAFHWLRTQVANLQSVARAPQVAEAHYELGNDFFTAMLGPTMTYSCAYWKDATDLDAAQEAKLDLAARKLQVQPGDHVLDIGCGWGSLAHRLASKHGCRVTGVTLSRQQAEYARKLCEGLPVDILLVDYRAPEVRRAGPFDKVVSIGMFEHVGTKNYRTFMQVARDCLRSNGLVLVQTIGRTGWCQETDAWIHRYIFPNGVLPTMAEITAAADRIFVLEDWHNFGADYDRTLMAWHANFEKAIAEKARGVPPSRRFQRMWRYYLLTFAGSFRSRTRMQLWQLVFAPRGTRGGYRSPR